MQPVNPAPQFFPPQPPITEKESSPLLGLKHLPEEVTLAIIGFNVTSDPPQERDIESNSEELFNQAIKWNKIIVGIRKHVPNFKVLSCWYGQNCNISACTFSHGSFMLVAARLYDRYKTVMCHSGADCPRPRQACLFSHLNDWFVSHKTREIFYLRPEPIPRPIQLIPVFLYQLPYQNPYDPRQI